MKNNRFYPMFVLSALFLFACSTEPDVSTEAQAFLDNYTAAYKKLSYASAKAEWNSNTRIVEGDDTNAAATRKANEALAAFTGSVENINMAKELLGLKDQLEPLQVKQLETVLYLAANNPQTVPELVNERIKIETEAVEKLFGFDFRIDGVSVTTNQIDNILNTESNVTKRRAAWEASKEVGKVLKTSLSDLVRLRNATVKALDYDDYFNYQVSDYGMTNDELMALMRNINQQIRPLYKELHTYMRYELAKKYGVKSVPDMLPAHWLSNRWGQDWSAIVNVEGLDLDGVLKTKAPEWLVEQGERFYVSLGFDKLPQVFWEKSSLYPLPEGTEYKKNNHASAWHMDLENDVRSLMSVEPNSYWYETTHHELGHIYYYMEYTNPEVPPLMRGGANRAYHEGIGSLMGLAAMQKPFLANIDLIPANTRTDDIKILLKESLNYIVFIPWSAGVMSEFEYELYSKDLAPDNYNQKWWELKKKYQGIVPPADRGSEYNDAASKTHIINDAAQYYDYAISYILLFQLHDHIAAKILNQDPRSTNYYGSTAVGNFLKEIMRPGASKNWREVLKETTGSDLNAEAMLKYFQPLMEYLKEANKGRKHTLVDM